MLLNPNKSRTELDKMRTQQNTLWITNRFFANLPSWAPLGECINAVEPEQKQDELLILSL